MSSITRFAGRFGLLSIGSLLLAGCFDFGKETVSDISGSVGDGPVINATIVVTDKDGNEVATGTSDATASYALTVELEDDRYPLFIEATGGTDLVTAQPADFVMKSVSLVPAEVVTANINPFSTLIVETASRSAQGLSSGTVAAATDSVLSHLNFGLDPDLLADPVSGDITAANIAATVKACEAVGETLRRAATALTSAGYTISADGIVAAVGADMVDGVVDGLGADGTDARVAAVFNLVTAQVAVESISNDLLVLGSRAEPLMDSAIMITLPGAPASARTGTVTLNAEFQVQALRALGAASLIAPSPELDALMAAVGQLDEGATAGQARTAFGGQGGPALSSAISLAAQGNAADFETVNAFVRDGTRPATPANTAPQISGTPATNVDAGSEYYFRPLANDADGDLLTFSIANRPAWATFNSANGTLSGTPANGDAGTNTGVVITVSDGQATASLAAFSVTVSATAVPNSPPVLSGTPATQVVAGESYVFAPQASDADGDALTFSISGKPGWASFDNASGRLSGTPGASDVGSYGGIAISVSDGTDTASLPVFSVEVVAAPSNLSATLVVQQQNNTGTLLEATNLANGQPLNGQVVSGVLRVRSEVDGSGLWCCKRYEFNSDGSIYTAIEHNAAWTSRPVSAGSVHEFDTRTLPNGDYELYIGVNDGTEAFIVFTVENDGSAPPVNNPPVISGSPAGSVTAGDTYVFQPQASDPDGDALSFSITGKPVWASFNAATGRLAGTPGDANVGTFSGITISVSDGQLSSSMGPFSITVDAAEPENRAPVISGTPGDSVLAGSLYSFAPQASDPDGDTLSFTISNKPAWASFNSSTGTLSGTPESADVGTYYDIVITVSDGTLSASLASFSITVTDVATGFALLSWIPPTERVDGTPLDQLAGFKVYYGTSPNGLSPQVTLQDAAAVDYLFENLPAGTHYFAVLAYDSAGLESALSNVASKTIE